jgi:hypothetical protein
MVVFVSSRTTGFSGPDKPGYDDNVNHMFVFEC